MIINLNQFGGGGGGGSYVLPVATSEVLGGVMIGDGINVDSAGTISVSGSDVSNYAMALKSLQEGDENNYKVANYGGFLYYVEDNKNTEKNIFVKAMYGSNYVNIDMDIDGQTDTDIVEFNGVTITIDKEGNLFYVNENDEKVYYDSEVSEYQYGDFTFYWDTDGTHIGFSQQANYIEAIPSTDNFENWFCIAQNVNIANQDALGLVKIGEGIDLAEDGTISVEGGGIEVVTSLPESGTDGQMVLLNKNIDVEGCVVYNASNNNPLEIGLHTEGIDGNRFSINGFRPYTAMTRIIRFEAGDDSLNILSDGENFYWNQYNESTQEWVFQDQLLSDGTTTINPADLGGMNFAINATISGNVLTGSLDWVPWFTVFVKDMPINIHKKQLYVFDTVSQRCTAQTFQSENLPTRSVITYFGELPVNQILFEFYYSFWGRYDYVSYDGISTFKVWQDSGMTEMRYSFDFDSTKEADFLRISATDGFIVMDMFANGIITSVYGNWADVGNGNWKPVEYDELVNNAYQYTTKYTAVRLYAPQVFDGEVLWTGGQNGIFTLHIPQTSGEEGQILYASGNYDIAPKWGPLPIHIVDQLSSYGSDDSLYVVTNDNISTPASGAFISRNSTNISDKNNFSFTDETGHMGDGQYIYVNKGNYTSTGDTLVFVIQMRTNENGDWNTSDLKDINVYLKYDSGNNAYYYEAEWNFSYNNVTYNSAITISDGQSVDTDYLPIWKYWDGGYGYKFNFVNSGDNLTFALRNSNYDRDTEYSGYVEGEQYGDIAIRNPYYVKEFFNIGTSNTLSTLYTFKGGQWINLGETQVPV